MVHKVLKNWMTFNKLKLDEEKPEILIFKSNGMNNCVDINSIKIRGLDVRIVY